MLNSIKSNKAYALKKGAAALITAATLITLAFFTAGCNSDIESATKPKFVVTFSVEEGSKAYGTLTARVGEGVGSNAFISGNEAEEGAKLTFTAKVADGYRVKSWSLDGSPVASAGTELNYSFKVTKKADVKVSFEEILHAVSFEAVSGEGGSAHGRLKATVDGKEIGSGDGVREGKEVTFTAEADAGWYVDEWQVSPSSALQSVGTDESKTATVKITAATKVSVSFDVYKTVAFGEGGASLAEHLKSATPSSDGACYVKVIGLTAADLKGSRGQSPLGKILKNSNKKVALKLPKSIDGLTSMSFCFFGCGDLVSLVAVPKGVENMDDCFTSCGSLVKMPALPEGVKNMNQCFWGCGGLKETSAIHAGVKTMLNCFRDCTSLEKAPKLPEGAQDISGCFYGCTKLKEVPALPASVKDMSL